MKSKISLATAVVVVSAVAVFAHGGATGVIKERMDGMSAMSEVVKQLSTMMRGEVDYDAEIVRKGAMVLEMHSGESLVKLFPEGSDAKPSEAKPEIWSEAAEFNSLASQLAAFATALAVAADNPPMRGGEADNGSMMDGSSDMMGGSGMMGTDMMGADMMGADMMPYADRLAAMPVDGVFNLVTKTCSACHTKYRFEKK